MWQVGKVIDRTDWSERLFSLKIAVDVGPYLAGQFIKLAMQLQDKRVARAYSIINPPGSNYIEVLAVAVPDGQLSPALHLLQPGDAVDVSVPASGFLTLNELPRGELQGRHLWMLATGTAVGPFLAILDTAEPWQRFEKIVLVYGARQADELAYCAKLQTMAHERSQFCFLPAITREIRPGMLHCRIPDGLTSGVIEQQAGIAISATDSQVMLCGNPGMIRDSITVLTDKGLRKNLRRAPGQITTEKYW
ncbi:ferredoxin--NADP reductase [Shewanella dokdonensis]|uniref:ferredoxin--NADP(+) reductase n=1 Tax=Shewanella dokdonensis TaxID=712036 RepID=A0ABX8DH10_9GAMM|nr:ferredoxin--NADP reductase [Shewanella dokdonensis]MCL1074259.1 ferredoxin--NADP reductase [Shewanella dokdonensis]QVK23965.1 ferredoxin--NADP reductase [Shewanella dokdonensis]